MRAGLRRVEVWHRPHRARRAWTYGALGAVVGAAAAGGLGYVATKDNVDWGGFGAVLAVPGFLAGGIVGAISGANSGWRWVPARLPAPAAP